MSDTWENPPEAINGDPSTPDGITDVLNANGTTDKQGTEMEMEKMTLENDGPEPSEEPIEEEDEPPAPSGDIDDREHLNVVFIGHVDAGKSTLGGQILFLTGNVDERTIQKYEKEAKEKNRDSWYMAYIMDTNEEERDKGKTVEVGRANFSTEKRRFTILDAPGHKNYVPNMISGAAQADIGVMVIAARRGEFETGFERGGQTREHAQLAKTLGVMKLIVAVNKMDDPSILGPNGQWSEPRFREIETRLGPFLKNCGYNPKKDVVYVPISALIGTNVRDPVADSICPWWKEGSLLNALDEVEVTERDPSGPFRMSILDKYKDMGVILMGKSESGMVSVGDTLILMPNRHSARVEALFCDDSNVNKAGPGENLRVKLSGIEESDVQSGFVLSSIERPVPVVRQFEAQLMVLDLLEHKAVFTAGYKAVLHVHSLVEECEVTKLLYEINLKTREQKRTKFVRSNTMVVCRIAMGQGICVEEFQKVPQLGRFTLRDEGQTIAIGKVTKLPKHD